LGMEKSGIDPKKRAEMLEIDDFIRLTEALDCFFDKPPMNC
jgi:16S rRNA A1518/A1519 N6-dimethyltransferase RsmA/KsgA/DIM1 with predicted DNA glycosylase/AP lyase activity